MPGPASPRHAAGMPLDAGAYPAPVEAPAPAEHRVRVALLGPLVVTVDGDEVRIPGRLARATLTMLAVEGGRFVSSSTLIDRLWEEPPASARNTLQTYLTHLRRALDRGRANAVANAVAGRSPAALERTGDAYRLTAALVDLATFESLVDAAKRATDPNVRLAAAGSALALWRGDPLPDLGPSSFADAERTRLGELLGQAQSLRVVALLELGDHGAAIASAEIALDAHPYDEGLWELAILGRYRAGRQADALATYQRARRLLADELGLTPSARLQALEAAVLANDAALLGTEAAPHLDRCPQPPARVVAPPEVALRPVALRQAPVVDRSPDVAGHRVSVVIGEDDLLVREGLQRLLARHDDVVVLAVATTRDEVMDAVDRCRPDVLLTDIRMPPRHRDEGIEIARGLQQTQPDIGVVVLSQCADSRYARALFSPTSARRGYLLKEHLGRPDQLLTAIRTVADGGSFLDPTIVELLVSPPRWDEGCEQRREGTVPG